MSASSLCYTAGTTGNPKGPLYWIGRHDLENTAVAHPAVQQPACIGVLHPQRDERPLLVIVKRHGIEVSRDELLAFFVGKVAKW